METYNVSKDICEVIGTGSSGNAVLYHRQILIDIGLPYNRIEPYKNEIQLVLITHNHKSDHLNIQGLKKLCFERPTLRVACGEWMVEHLQDIRHLDVLEANTWYNYGNFKIAPFHLWHDVKNYGYRIIKDDHKTFHATDTSTLYGLDAKDYDLFCIESNYNEDTIFKSIEKKESNGDYAYQKGSVNTHLSEQEARHFIFKNRSEHSKVVRLHESGNS